MPERLRAAIVGCGFQGKLHAEIFAAMDGVEVAAVCDRDEGRARAVATEFGVPGVFGDHRALLDAGAYDLVTVCTMPDTHRAITLDAFECGANVLCEKPFALDATQGLEMIAAAERAGRLLSVGFNMRFMDGALALRRFIEDGQMGRPVCGRGWMLAGDVPWWGKHYIKAVSGGGALAATAVHVIDLATWLAGCPKPLTATASTARIFPLKRGAGAPSPEAREAFDVEDTIFGHVRFEGGFWLTVEGSWVWDEPGWNYSLDLVGDGGHGRLEPLRLTTEQEGEALDVTGDARGGMDFPPSVARELADVVAAIREEREPVVRAREALVVQSITDALYRSAEAGHEVDVVVPEHAPSNDPAARGAGRCRHRRSRGIGAASVRALAAAGARVSCSMSTPRPGAGSSPDCARKAWRCRSASGDAADEGDVEAIAEDAGRRHGRPRHRARERRDRRHGARRRSRSRELAARHRRQPHGMLPGRPRRAAAHAGRAQRRRSCSPPRLTRS